jgi:hypothetical protein
LLLKGEPCSGLTHQAYDYIDGKPMLEWRQRCVSGSPSQPQ